MCFSKPVTLGILLLEIATALLLQLRGRSIQYYQLFYVFALMEALQYIQYLYLDQCDHWVNQLTTILTYAHICFQPVSICLYAFKWEPNRDLAQAMLRLCIMSGIMMLLRLPYLGVTQHLASISSFLGPQLIPEGSTAGTAVGCGVGREPMCGPVLCARSGAAHLRWEVPLLSTTYVLAGMSQHCLMLFGPALVSPGVYHRQRMFLMLITFVAGPLLSLTWSYAAAGEAYRFEWPALWCAYSFFQCVFAAVYELATHTTDAKQIGTEGSVKYHQMVAEGRLFDQVEVMGDHLGNKKRA